MRTFFLMICLLLFYFIVAIANLDRCIKWARRRKGG